MRILVTGGAGYIGSNMGARLLAEGHQVVVIDDLSSGHRECVAPGVPFAEVDVGDRPGVAALLRAHRVEAIFHFASRIQVGESVRDPRLYYTGNLAAAIGLLESALDAGVGLFILSSTAAVYGNPIRTPIDEDHPTHPVNPYGATKLAIERMLGSYAEAYGLKYAALRYFNAAGADVDAGLGERHQPETHLIPIVLEAALGRRPFVEVFGSDYDTPDGTCIRDYIHVSDLCAVHLAALEFLTTGGDSGAFNVGTGQGHSVAEVIASARRVTGRPISVKQGARRAGDPARLVAAPDRAQKVLGWRAKRPLLDDIVSDAWRFHTRGP
ncbi:MAG: UDP-glucose 4-epimerase GalE [Polyangiaceae bacterium]|jgi:UDP-glucose 4-epimerase